MQRSSQRWWMEKLKTAIRIKLIKKKEKEKERWVNTISDSSNAYKVQLEEGIHDWRFRNSWVLDQFTLIEDRRHDYKTRILHKFNSTGCKPGPEIFDQGHPSSPEKSNFEIIKEGSVYFDAFGHIKWAVDHVYVFSDLIGSRTKAHRAQSFSCGWKSNGVSSEKGGGFSRGLKQRIDRICSSWRQKERKV